MATSARSFVWYELMTSDVAGAKSFYGNLIGWTIQDMPMPGMIYTLLDMGTTQIGGMMPIPKEALGMKPCWVGYIGVDDVDRSAAEVERLGGKIYRPPSDIPEVGRFAVVADPQGAVFNLFKGTKPGGRTVSNDVGNFGWHELHTREWPKAFDFYSTLFGWVKDNPVDMGPMGTYQLFSIGGTPAGAMFNSPAAESTRFWLYYINVGDIDAAGKKITDGGGKILQGPHSVPGDMWIIQATDPQGAAFAVVGKKK